MWIKNVAEIKVKFKQKLKSRYDNKMWIHNKFYVKWIILKHSNNRTEDKLCWVQAESEGGDEYFRPKWIIGRTNEKPQNSGSEGRRVGVENMEGDGRG